MPAQIDHLLVTRDTLEIVRDQIAAILALESAQQMALAPGSGKDPLDWELHVYTDRVSPIGEYLQSDAPRLPPIVVVYFQQDSFDGKASDQLKHRYFGTFVIDCYGYGCSKDDPNDAQAHLPGDIQAEQEATRAARLVRQILVATPYFNLGLPGLVGKRQFVARENLTPSQEERPVSHVSAFRLKLQVDFDEFSPENSFPNIESVAITFTRDGDGRVLVAADYPLT